MSGNYTYFIVLIAMMVIMYLIMFLPQRKRDKKLRELRNNLEVGDIVVTDAGIVGKVISVKDLDTVTIESGADKTKLKFKRWAIVSVENESK